jgi:hypothetical protein
LFDRQVWKKGFIIFISIYFSLLVAFKYIVQIDLVQSWKRQRVFWSKVIELCPDMDKNTVIFVRNGNLPETKFIRTYAWTTSIIPRYLYKFPKNWSKKEYPKLYVLKGKRWKKWKNKIVKLKNGKLHWFVPQSIWRPYWEELPESNLIILKKLNKNDNSFIRIDGYIDIKGKKFKLKDKPLITKSKYKKGKYYDLLLNSL